MKKRMKWNETMNKLDFCELWWLSIGFFFVFCFFITKDHRSSYNNHPDQVQNIFVVLCISLCVFHHYHHHISSLVIAKKIFIESSWCWWSSTFTNEKIIIILYMMNRIDFYDCHGYDFVCFLPGFLIFVCFVFSL